MRIFFLFLAAFLFLQTAAVSIPLHPVDSFQVGDTIEFETVNTLDGGEFNFSDYRGKKFIIVAFWLQTCDKCFDHLARLQKFLDENDRRSDVEVITVTRGKSKLEREFIESTIKRRDIKFKVLLDPEIYLARHFSTTEIPAYALIDMEGRLAAPVVHSIDMKIRDYSILELADILREGKQIPRTQFVPYTGDKSLKPMIGKPAPGFALKSTTGKEFNIFEYRDKMNVMVVFWHPYCSHCTRMMRKLAGFYDEHRKEFNFVLLSISSIYGFAQEDETKKFLKETGAEYPVLVDTESATGKQYNVGKMPQVVIVDKKGIVIDIQQGEISNYEKTFIPFLEEMVE